MSFLVLHMDKFKKETVRGIQSHNKRERESHSNPDIDYERSAGNYDLHECAADNYAEAIQNRVDDLLLVKAVRKDAVHMCGLVVSSDSAFFEKLSPEETKRFFEESNAFLTEFVGKENVLSAMVHMDEKTPHMHFLHVPVTPDGRLNANKIYTRESLKKLQTELPHYLRSRGFDLRRGVEQVPGAAKKHLNTREFKQQQEALHGLEKEAEAVNAKLEQRQKGESELRERLQSFERQAREAEKELSAMPELPQASMFNYKSALEAAQRIIERQKQALSSKSIVEEQKKKLETENGTLKNEVRQLSEKVDRFAATFAEEEKLHSKTVSRLINAHDKTRAQLDALETFTRQPEIMHLHIDYIQREREFARKREAEQKEKALERERQERQRQEEQQRREVELAKEKEAQQWERRPRGMGMCR